MRSCFLCVQLKFCRRTRYTWNEQLSRKKSAPDKTQGGLLTSFMTLTRGTKSRPSESVQSLQIAFGKTHVIAASLDNIANEIFHRTLPNFSKFYLLFCSAGKECDLHQRFGLSFCVSFVKWTDSSLESQRTSPVIFLSDPGARCGKKAGGSLRCRNY